MMTVMMMMTLDYPWKDDGRVAEVFCMFLAHFPWNRYVNLHLKTLTFGAMLQTAQLKLFLPNFLAGSPDISIHLEVKSQG